MVLNVLLDISSWLQATEAYITSQQETQRVHRTGDSTQLTSAEGSRRDSKLPATSPTQDATTDVSEAFQERVMKHLRKAPILDMTTTREEFGSDDAAGKPPRT